MSSSGMSSGVKSCRSLPVALALATNSTNRA